MTLEEQVAAWQRKMTAKPSEILRFAAELAEVRQFALAAKVAQYAVTHLEMGVLIGIAQASPEEILEAARKGDGP